MQRVLDFYLGTLHVANVPALCRLVYFCLEHRIVHKPSLHRLLREIYTFTSPAVGYFDLQGGKLVAYPYKSNHLKAIRSHPACPIYVQKLIDMSQKPLWQLESDLECNRIPFALFASEGYDVDFERRLRTFFGTYKLFLVAKSSDEIGHQEWRRQQLLKELGGSVTLEDLLEHDSKALSCDMQQCKLFGLLFHLKRFKFVT